MNTPPEFPAGEYQPPGSLEQPQRESLIEQLASFPQELGQVVAGLDNSQLDTKYRNWTIRQIVHHLADSHTNCYVRWKLALTEDSPTIKSYDETLWSEVSDAKSLPVESSLQMLSGLHSRWAQLGRQLDTTSFARGFFHPELERIVTLEETLPNYVWHGLHHKAQIEWVKQQHDW